MGVIANEVETALYLVRIWLITATLGHMGARPLGTAGMEPLLIRPHRARS